MFGEIFNTTKSKEESAIDWIQLESMEQLDEIDTSKNLSVIFKHSNRCGISSMVLRRVEREFDIAPNLLNMYILDLLNYRNISNEIANRYEVVHESPQLIVIRKGKVIAHNSHSGIHTITLKYYL